ncbi:MAG: hypothetical protein JSW73_01730 [Candidatus Woesearchaeota archaeon]|nr:MAG: hypothetical protein JSW73_01730 [Candidatus Woesearchaeota archaeon]
MDTKGLKEAIKKAKESKPRKFTQTIELIVKLRGYDPKKDGDINMIVDLPKIHKTATVCAIVGPELLDKSNKCDKVLTDKQLEALNDKEALELAKTYDFFLAQVQLMPQLAKKVGRILGPLGKMPNPKRGQVLSPKSDVNAVAERLKTSIKVSANRQKAITTIVGDEKMSDNELVKNVEVILDSIKKALPSSQAVIDNIKIKTTMGKPIKLK